MAFPSYLHYKINMNKSKDRKTKQLFTLIDFLCLMSIISYFVIVGITLTTINIICLILIAVYLYTVIARIIKG